MRQRQRVLVALLALTTLPAAVAVGGARSKSPRLNLKATPRMALSPANVTLTAELVGGDEQEDYYCPSLEWDWDDGSHSTHESDCPPFAERASFERRFSAAHQFRGRGDYNVRVILRHADRELTYAVIGISLY
jgi:hypothetical protein